MQLHIRYLRSLEDSERVRATCVKFLQTGLVHAYPQRPDIVEEAQRMAEALGGHLEAPTLSRKYAPIAALFGLEAAKKVQSVLQPVRSSFARRLDRSRLRLDQLTGLDHAKAEQPLDERRH